MKKISITRTFIFLLLLVPAFFNACKKNDVVTKVFPKPVQLMTSATLGTYMADQDGRSVYMFANDANGQPSCTGGCEATWPPFYIPDFTANDIDPQLNMSDFAVITTPSGKGQITYKGWPLYLHSPAVNGTNTPEDPGVTTGDGIGGIWFIAKPDYSIMLSNTQLIGTNGKSYKSDYTEGVGKTTYFTDASGVALYTFKNDKNNKNNFTKADFSNNTTWPIYENDKLVVPSILDKTLFGSIDVFGKKQVTYKGWPLYKFGQDAAVRGANKGVSFPSGPGTWFVAVKDVAVAP